jgi:gliding motility-associated-like protein
MLIKHFLLSLLITIAGSIIAQRGSFGNQTINAQDTWVNSYTHLTNNASAGSTSITVNDNAINGGQFSGALAQGELILIMQMQGASVDVNVHPTTGWGGYYTVQQSFFSNGNNYDITEFGDINNYNGAGHFEYAEVASVSGSNSITLNCGLKHNYDITGNVQVIRVPRYEDLTIQNNTSISAPQWNGISGGVIAIEMNGDLTITGTGSIDADAIGFRGGTPDNQSSNAPSAGTNSGFMGSSDVTEGAEKGEGIFGTYADLDDIYSRYCRGSISNGGGGANYHNAGGGGGSNVGTGAYYAYGVPAGGPSNSYVAAWNLEDPTMFNNPSSGGGRGGYSHAVDNNDPFVVPPNDALWGIDYRRNTGGVGGHPLTYDTERLFLGGGGGAGDDNNNYGGAGGRGGGIVMLQVYGAISGTGSMTANGENGGNSEGATPLTLSNQKTGDDGAGGAGGGGSIHVMNMNAIPPSLTLSAIGGNGGDQIFQYGNFTSPQVDGTGGGGSGGLIVYTSGNPTQNINGGLAGVTDSEFVPNFPVNGATGGAVGMNNVNDGISTDMFDLLVENDTVCGGGSTTLTVTVDGTLPSGSSILWYNSSFGGTSIQSGTSFTTPNLSANTTYYVGVCPGTFRIPVEVIVSPPIVISGTATTSPETCAGNDGSIAGLTASGGFGNLIFDWNGTVTPSENLLNAVGGTYTLTVTDDNGCTATSGPHTISPSPGPSIDLTNLNVQDETCLGNDGSITGIVASGSNIVIDWNGTIYPDENITGLIGGTYLLTVTDDANCTTTAGPFTVNTDPGPSIDDANIQIVDETCLGGDGEITGIVATGTGLSYEWNGNNTLSEDTVGLDAGTYTLTVTDGVGCTATSGPHVVDELPGPSIDDSNIQIEDEGCNQGNGSVTGITASGNNLAFLWNGTIEPQIDINNLSAGSYTLEVVDDLGCSITSGPYTVNNIAGPTIDISNSLITGETCNGSDGSVTGIQVSGAGSITYSWSPSGQTTLDLIDVAEGTYALEVTDGNGCTETAGPFVIELIPSPTIDASNIVVNQSSCEGGDGSITGINVTGGDLSFDWNGQTYPSSDANGLDPGNYTLVITDSNNCSETYGPVTVNGSDVPSVSILTADQVISTGESVNVDASVNPVSATIEWNPTEDLSCSDCEDPIISPESSGWYVITATSADGCSRSDSIFIEVIDPCGEVMVPTIFSPNNDGLNDELCVLGGCIQTMTIQVFNRWGELIFESNQPDNCWNGSFRDQKVNTGTYIYKLSGTRNDGTSFEMAGNVNVVR